MSSSRHSIGGDYTSLISSVSSGEYTAAMTPNDVLEVSATIIAGLGGGGAIVFGLSGYLGKV
jgi:hypothetical protein